MMIPAVVVVVPVLLFLGPYMLIPAISGLAVVSAPSSLFATDELGRLDTLYTALGIRLALDHFGGPCSAWPKSGVVDLDDRCRGTRPGGGQNGPQPVASLSRHGNDHAPRR